MKNRIAYFIYYVKYHKRNCVATIINLVLLVMAIVDACMSIRGMSFFDKLGIKWGSVGAVVVIAINLIWSIVDGFLADAVENMSQIRSIEPSLEVMDNLECDYGEKSVEVNGQRAFYRDDVNRMLTSDKEFAIKTDDKEPKNIERFINKRKDELFGFLRQQYRLSMIEGKMFFNEKKLCLTSDLYHVMRSNKSVVKVHKGCYYDTFLTNICSTKKLEDGTDDRTIYDGSTHYPRNGNNHLRLLEDSHMNNEIGISTIAFTSDNYIVIWKSNNKAMINMNLVVPSGSGSADWKDRENKDTLSDAVCYSMQRELEEESSLIQNENCEQIRKNSKTKIIGYWRWLNKGGKPEFVGVTKLDCELSDIHPNPMEVCEFNDGHYYVPDRTAEAVAKFADDMMEKYSENMSLPMHMNLLFLKDYVMPEDNGKINMEKQKERIAFLLGEDPVKSEEEAG